MREARDFYQQHGWYVADIFSTEEMNEFEYAVERFYAGEPDRQLDLRLSRDWTPERGGIMRQNDYISLRMDSVRKLLYKPLLGQTAASLAGCNGIRLFHDQLICKPPRCDSTAVGWHTDKAYWNTCSSNNMITAWIPLQDCTDDMGPLVVVDGSHLWNIDAEGKAFHSQDLQRITEKTRVAFERAEKVPLTLRRGQVSFHHCLALHGSYPNRSDRTRLSLSVHLQDDPNRYIPAKDLSGAQSLHQNDMLCRRDAVGFPDYSDPDVFPTLWLRPAVAGQPYSLNTSDHHE